MLRDLQERTDDVILAHHGDRMIATAGPVLRQTGWRGGIWVYYVPPTGPDLFVVERSNGNTATAFLLFPSEEYGVPTLGATENYTSRQFRGPEAMVPSGISTITIIAGGGRQLFRVFETVSLTAMGTRTGGPANYQLNEGLYVSENGLLCNDSIINLQAAGIANPIHVGVCCLVPIPRGNPYLGLDLKY